MLNTGISVVGLTQKMLLERTNVEILISFNPRHAIPETGAI